ncbi:MAG: hypothetical protein IH851_01505 [Armatimonadetes bacterium]|nr:hypothetical protein [Armatimonadota bacterium]
MAVSTKKALGAIAAVLGLAMLVGFVGALAIFGPGSGYLFQFLLGAAASAGLMFVGMKAACTKGQARLSRDVLYSATWAVIAFMWFDRANGWTVGSLGNGPLVWTIGWGLLTARYLYVRSRSRLWNPPDESYGT